VAAGPAEELGAQAVVHPPVLGPGSHWRVTHRPQAGVLAAQRHGDKTSYSAFHWK